MYTFHKAQAHPFGPNDISADKNKFLEGRGETLRMMFGAPNI